MNFLSLESLYETQDMCDESLDPLNILIAEEDEDADDNCSNVDRNDKQVILTRRNVT